LVIIICGDSFPYPRRRIPVPDNDDNAAGPTSTTDRSVGSRNSGWGGGGTHAVDIGIIMDSIIITSANDKKDIVDEHEHDQIVFFVIIIIIRVLLPCASSKSDDEPWCVGRFILVNIYIYEWLLMILVGIRFGFVLGQSFGSRLSGLDD
jgi:hypothetical protein